MTEPETSALIHRLGLAVARLERTARWQRRVQEAMVICTIINFAAALAIVAVALAIFP